MANLKSIKKGDKVILRMFTGAFVGSKTVEMADAKKLGFTNNSGIKMVFDKETGKQITPAPKNEKYANFVEEYDAKVEKAELAKKSSKTAAKATKKKTAPAPEDPEEDEDFEEAEEETLVKSKKKAVVKAKATKVKAKPVAKEDEDEDSEESDNFEEVE